MVVVVDDRYKKAKKKIIQQRRCQMNFQDLFSFKILFNWQRTSSLTIKHNDGTSTHLLHFFQTIATIHIVELIQKHTPF